MKASHAILGAVILVLAVSGCAKQTAAHIRPRDVTMTNVEAYEQQVVKDLPMGTPKKDVEAYLAREKIGGFFVDAADPVAPILFMAASKTLEREWALKAVFKFEFASMPKKK
jgi:hypothetical protein